MADVKEYEVKDVHPKVKTGTTKKGNPYRVFDLLIEGDLPESCDGWVSLFSMKEEKPTTGSKIKGAVEKDNFGGWKLEEPRDQQGRGGSGYKRDTGVEVQIAAHAAASALYAGALNPSDAKAWEKQYLPLVEDIASDIRKASDNRITAAQRGLLFGEMDKRDTPKDFETEVRDLDRAGRLTKEVASQKIEEVKSFAEGNSRETRTYAKPDDQG